MKTRPDIKRRLGVNIDHIATLREARRASYPVPCDALEVLKECGVDQVTIHLREDRRHIQDEDFVSIVRAGILPVNLEMAVTDEMVSIASRQQPATATFVPERREEITTEGGLNCILYLDRITRAVCDLKNRGVRVSLFIDPDIDQAKAAREAGADAIEIHTGSYCHVLEEFYAARGHYDFYKDQPFCERVQKQLGNIKKTCDAAVGMGLKVFAGHGMHRFNLRPVVAIENIEEYNIGHAIIARAIFVGLEKAINEITAILNA